MNARAGSLFARSAATSALVGCVALGAACGGDKVEKVDADDWVEDLCAATSRLRDAEGDAFDDFDELFDDSDDGEAIRDGFFAYVKAYKSALERFERSVTRAGEPDVRQGDRVVDAVRNWVKDEHRGVDRAEREAKGLDEEGPDLVDAVDEVFFSIKFADLLDLLEDSDSPDADDIIELIDEDQECANYLFAE